MIIHNNQERKMKRILWIGFMFFLLQWISCGSSSQIIKKSASHKIRISIPVGSFSESRVEMPCGYFSPEGMVECHDIDEFIKPNRVLARLIWFANTGYVTYTIKNPLAKNHQLHVLRIFFEASSELLRHDVNFKTDLSVYLNGKKLITKTLVNDLTERRGIYPLPDWKDRKKLNYGIPIWLECREDGVFWGRLRGKDVQSKIIWEKVLDENFIPLLKKSKIFTLVLAIEPDAKNKGGLNLFGAEVGNLKDPFYIELDYDGEPIFQPTIGEILQNPQKFKNKKVLLTVSPGGWGCPSGNATRIPEGFSRSAMMFYDSSGCMYYKNPTFIVGNIWAPELHPIQQPGKERIVVLGLIKADSKGTPFLIGGLEETHYPAKAHSFKEKKKGEILEFTGVIRYSDLEGGFYYIEANGKNYLPIGLPEMFRKEGLKVFVKGTPQKDVMTIQMFGIPFKILDIKKVK